MDRAARIWAAGQARLHPELSRLGYFGSYARGDWGAGSDLDLIAIVDHASDPFERRAARWDRTSLPVPADIVVYTAAEWQAMPPDARFVETIRREAVWLYIRGG